MSAPLHVIFGAGQVGSRLAIHLAAAGHRVRVVRRSDRPVGPGIEIVATDAMQPDLAVEAARGASVIYHCMNPSAYSQEAWEAEFPLMGEAVIAAALAHEARLVCLDNVYAYGPTSEPRKAHSPMKAEGAKGRVRIQWDARLHEAARAQGLRWTAVRAGDFFGPGTSEQSLMSMDAVAGLGRGRPALLIGSPSHPHSFSFVPDVVRALAAVGAAEAGQVEGRAWMAPVHTVSPRELVGRLARAQGRRGWTITLPAWLIRSLAPIVPLFSDLRETLYQWEGPFLIDDSDLKARLPLSWPATDEVIRQTISELRTRSPEAISVAA